MPVGTQGQRQGAAALPSCATWARRSCSATPTTCTSGPAPSVIAELGGLHRFMAWDGPILTDSGGFQVFSLRHTADRVDDDGVTFRSVYDGSRAPLHAGARDGGAAAARLRHRDGVRRVPAAPTSTRGRSRRRCGARRCGRSAAVTASARAEGQLVFGIVQGGDRPRRCARAARATSSRSDSTATRSAGSRWARSAGRCSRRSPRPPTMLPADRPRYFMGIGDPDGLIGGDRARRRHVRLRAADPPRAAPEARSFQAGRMNLRNARVRPRRRAAGRGLHAARPAAASRAPTSAT